MCSSDLVVSRAGAGTLTELVRCGTPAILVPFPQAADDHQAANAAWFVREGGGMVVPQGELARLETAVREVIADARRREEYRANLQRMDQADHLGALLRDLEELTTGRRQDGVLALA